MEGHGQDDAHRKEDEVCQDVDHLDNSEMVHCIVQNKSNATYFPLRSAESNG